MRKIRLAGLVSLIIKYAFTNAWILCDSDENDFKWLTWQQVFVMLYMICNNLQHWMFAFGVWKVFYRIKKSIESSNSTKV